MMRRGWHPSSWPRAAAAAIVIVVLPGARATAQSDPPPLQQGSLPPSVRIVAAADAAPASEIEFLPGPPQNVRRLDRGQAQENEVPRQDPSNRAPGIRPQAPPEDQAFGSADQAAVALAPPSVTVMQPAAVLRVVQPGCLVLQTDTPASRAEIVDPTVCQLRHYTARELALVGCKTGTTYLLLWFDDHREATAYRIEIGAACEPQTANRDASAEGPATTRPAQFTPGDQRRHPDPRDAPSAPTAEPQTDEYFLPESQPLAPPIRDEKRWPLSRTLPSSPLHATTVQAAYYSEQETQVHWSEFFGPAFRPPRTLPPTRSRR